MDPMDSQAVTHLAEETITKIHQLSKLGGHLRETLSSDHSSRLKESAISLIRALVEPAEVISNIVDGYGASAVRQIGIKLGVFGILSRHDAGLSTEQLVAMACPLGDRQTMDMIFNYAAHHGFFDEIQASVWQANHMTRILALHDVEIAGQYAWYVLDPLWGGLPSWLAKYNYGRPRDPMMGLGRLLDPLANAPDMVPAPQVRALPYWAAMRRLELRWTKSWVTLSEGRQVQELVASLSQSGKRTFRFIDLGGSVSDACEQLAALHPKMASRLIMRDHTKLLESVKKIPSVTYDDDEFFDLRLTGLSQIFHIKDQLCYLPARACRIFLQSFTTVMGPKSRLLIDELWMPNDAQRVENFGAHGASLSNWVTHASMETCLLGGQLRTEQAWQQLLADAGLETTGAVTYGTPNRRGIVFIARLKEE